MLNQIASWKRLNAPIAATALTLLAQSALMAQIPILRLNNSGPAGPTIAGAPQLTTDRTKPVQSILVKLREGVEPKRFGQTFSASVRAAKRASAISEDQTVTFNHSNKSLGWHTYKLSSPSSLARTLASIKTNPDVLSAKAWTQVAGYRRVDPCRVPATPSLPAPAIKRVPWFQA